MIVPYIEELEIVGVFDHGIPNMERIAIFANSNIDLGNYGLLIGIRGSDGQAFPLRDNFLWFGNGWVQNGDWVFVYTGNGEPKTTELPSSRAKLHSIHWGKESTLFQHKELTPILIRIDAIQIPSGKNTLPSS